jgi:hypothetical protein
MDLRKRLQKILDRITKSTIRSYSKRFESTDDFGNKVIPSKAIAKCIYFEYKVNRIAKNNAIQATFKSKHLPEGDFDGYSTKNNGAFRKNFQRYDRRTKGNYQRKTY